MLRPTWRFLPMILRPTDLLRPVYGRKINQASNLVSGRHMIEIVGGQNISMDVVLSPE